MNGSAERRTSGSSSRRDNSEGLLTLEAATAMLPLAGLIAKDIVHHAASLAHCLPEKAGLDARRHELDWAGRSRRYELDGDIAQLELELRRFQSELDALGVVLLDPLAGLIGFPTIVNDQRAFFSWMPGEASLVYWSYLGASERHPVPPSWTKQVLEIRPARRRRASR